MGASNQKVPWYHRHDLWIFVGGLLFISVLIGAMFGAGTFRSWDAPSGYAHNYSLTSPIRFLPEPSQFDPYPNMTKRQGADASGRWYYWKLKPWEVTLWSRLFVWCCYVGHQLSVWLVIYLAQVAKADSMEPKYSTQANKYNWICFGLNIFFHLMHLLQTHITYDALAQDVVVSSSQGSVIMLLIFVMLMHYQERGLFFGWPTLRHNGKVSVTLRFNALPINLARKYHGYGFAWAAIYTFWYHPMENTYGHALGFVYTWMFLLQGSMMYTTLHKNRWWRLTQEVWVAVHGGLVALQTGGSALKGTTFWPMFVFGFLWMLALTQIFLLDFWNKIPGWVRIFPMLICLGLTIGNYAWIPDAQGRTWVRIQEVIRIPGIYYLCVIFTWALLYLFMWIETKVKGQWPGLTPISKVKQGLYIIAFLLVYAFMVGLSAAIESAGIKLMMFVSMVLLIFVFLTGVCMTMMFLKQIVPAARRPQSDSDVKNSDVSVKKSPPTETVVEASLGVPQVAYDNKALELENADNGAVTQRESTLTEVMT